MQFQMGNKLYDIDDADFEAFVETWRTGQKCPGAPFIGLVLEYGEDDHIVLLNPLGKHLAVEFLVSRGLMDRNELLTQTIPYDKRRHCEVIGCS